jgi:hypothetical protein
MNVAHTFSVRKPKRMSSLGDLKAHRMLKVKGDNNEIRYVGVNLIYLA